MHRDLKPANLLYKHDEGRLVVCDLGEVCSLSLSRSHCSFTVAHLYKHTHKHTHTRALYSLLLQNPCSLFGRVQARKYKDGDLKEQRTPRVMSLRYRAPEVLFGSTHYTRSSRPHTRGSSIEDALSLDIACCVVSCLMYMCFVCLLARSTCGRWAASFPRCCCEQT